MFYYSCDIFKATFFGINSVRVPPRRKCKKIALYGIFPEAQVTKVVAGQGKCRYQNLYNGLH